VEEKVYRKQVFKGGLSRTGTSEGVQFRYFSQTARGLRPRRLSLPHRDLGRHAAKQGT